MEHTIFHTLSLMVMLFHSRFTLLIRRHRLNSTLRHDPDYITDT